MIDIFKDLVPRVYCADIEVQAIIPLRGNKKEAFKVRLNAHPITLINGEVASEKIKQRLFRQVYTKYINRSEFGKISFNIVSIKVIKFLSNICYDFNPMIH